MEKICPDSISALQDILKKNKYTIIDFYAEWCGPCKVFGPLLEELAKTYKDKDVKFYKIDVDESLDVCESQDITAMPTTIIYEGSELYEKVIGANINKVKESLEKLIEAKAAQ